MLPWLHGLRPFWHAQCGLTFKSAWNEHQSFHFKKKEEKEKKEKGVGAREMTQRLRAFTTLP